MVSLTFLLLDHDENTVLVSPQPQPEVFFCQEGVGFHLLGRFLQGLSLVTRTRPGGSLKEAKEYRLPDCC